MENMDNNNNDMMQFVQKIMDGVKESLLKNLDLETQGFIAILGPVFDATTTLETAMPEGAEFSQETFAIFLLAKLIQRRTIDKDYKTIRNEVDKSLKEIVSEIVDDLKKNDDDIKHLLSIQDFLYFQNMMNR